MKDKSLVERLSKLGFPLLETEEALDANATLADVVRSRDLRLWEGFPVVLANSTERGLFDYDSILGHLKEVSSERDNLLSLVSMSLALYKALNMKFSWATKLHKSLPPHNRAEMDSLVEKLKNDEDFEVAHRLMSSQRLRSTFNNYFGQVRSRVSELLSMKEESALEYSLSQVFSPKQKELFLRKLKGEKLSKTEKEYYSRVVKKKVLALANPELHRFARRLLES